MGLIEIIEKPMTSGSNKFPGLPILPHGIERYVIPGGCLLYTSDAADE